MSGIAPAIAQIGKRFPSEKKVVTDAVTGVLLTLLTTGPSSDAKIYQDHPQWTADGKWVIFRSGDRGAGSQAYAVNEETGAIVQVTEGPGNNTGTLNIAHKSMKLYFLRNRAAGAGGARSGEPAKETGAAALTAQGSQRGGGGGPIQMIEVDLAALFADSAAGTMKPASAYERICGILAQGMSESGGFGLDADEKFAYIGVRGGDTGQHLPPSTKVITEAPQLPGSRMGAGPAGLRSMNLETGEIKVIIDTPFQMGHVQTNPWMPGEIVYCWETGGDAPQRTWTVMADGSGNRPLYAETPDEWVTHEAVVTKDEVMYAIMGHRPELRLHPTGLAVINLRTRRMRILGQTPEGSGFWHVNGSPDGRWAVGDDFARNIYIMDRHNGEMLLLSAGHKESAEDQAAA